MPYPRHKPAPEEAMDRTVFEGENTLCQTIRDMYHMTEDPEIRLKLRVALTMSKSMCRKLMEYRDKYGPAGKTQFQDGIE